MVSRVIYKKKIPLLLFLTAKQNEEPVQKDNHMAEPIDKFRVSYSYQGSITHFSNSYLSSTEHPISYYVVCIHCSQCTEYSVEKYRFKARVVFYSLHQYSYEEIGSSKVLRHTWTRNTVEFASCLKIPFWTRLDRMCQLETKPTWTRSRWSVSSDPKLTEAIPIKDSYRQNGASFRFICAKI